MNKLLILLFLLLLLSLPFTISTDSSILKSELAGDVATTSSKLGLKTSLKSIAEISQDALKTLGKK